MYWGEERKSRDTVGVRGSLFRCAKKKVTLTKNEVSAKAKRCSATTSANMICNKGEICGKRHKRAAAARYTSHFRKG